MTGLSVDEVMGRSWSEVFASASPRDLIISYGERLAGKPEALHHESELVTREGERYWVRWNSIPLCDGSATIIGVGSIGEDISERGRLERALLDSSARERQRLEAELHDGLGQELFGLALQARSLAKSAARENIHNAEELERLSSDLSRAVDSCRRISRGVSPLGDLRGGLIGALRNLAETPKNWSGPAIEVLKWCRTRR